MNEPDLTINIRTLPWPDGTAKFFKEGAANRETAFIHAQSRDWNKYAYGYQVAYERLFESWHNHSMQVDVIAYPLVFLCRHYIELRLKELIQTCQHLLSLPTDWQVTHRIELLWKRVRPFVEEIWPNEPPATLDHVEAMIQEFALLDPKSMAFRYPIDREGLRHLPNMDSIDLGALRTAMSQIASFLDSVCGATGDYLDNLRSAV